MLLTTDCHEATYLLNRRLLDRVGKINETNSLQGLTTVLLKHCEDLLQLL